MLRQIGLLPAGCQPWNSNMLAGTRSKFAYCSTLAVYIYEMTPPFREYKLTSINAEHMKTITSISWNEKQPNLIATSGTDCRILIWDILKKKVIARLPNLKSPPSCIDWVHNSSGHPVVTYIGVGNYLEAWDITTGKISIYKHFSYAGSSRVTTFKWHHSKTNTIAFGHADGTISSFVQDKSMIKKKIVKFSEDADPEDAVVLLSWDPLSNEYLLVANKLSGLRLIDAVNGSVITAFQLPSRAVSTCTFSWVNSAPGMFLTGDKETGVLRLWTVGQEQPLENFKVKPMGFNGIHVLDPTHGEHCFDENLSYGSLRRKPSQSQALTHSVPPASVVCTFRDGGVGLYDLQKRKWVILKDQGHIETIFDCKFKPDDPKVLATASFDGTVKMWSTTDLRPIKTSAGNEGVIYSISWAPENLNCIACGTRRNGVFVWDYNKEKVIKRFKEHGNYTVYCVAWNQRDSRRIASGSEDGFCIVRRLDGQEKHCLSHPASVFGCEWNVFDKNLIATGCDDAVARIWSVTDESKPKCLHELKGHAKKVFHVRWHPLIKDILCTGSDDTTIRVWNIGTTTNSSCVGVLAGHSAQVRGLSWNYEIPHLLVSGSWDSTIRVWDARETEQRCISIIKDHGADVYGLTSHPSTPFTLASSSRDSTVRLWTLAPALTMLFAKVIVGHPLEDILCTAEDGMKTNSALRLAGKMSKQIFNELKQTPRPPIVSLRWFSELFCATPSLENLWDVACHAKGAKDSVLSPDYRTGIMHVDHLTKYKMADAQELEISAASKLQAGNRQQENVLERTAAVHLKLGNLRKHCELLKLLGRWETALSLAPGVSLEYWKRLATEYSDLLEESASDEYMQYRMAVGDCTKCIKDLVKAGEYEDALLISQSAIEGRAPPSFTPPRSNGHTNGSAKENGTMHDTELEEMRSNCIRLLSRMKYLDGDPYRAAAYMLSNNDVSNAINILVQSNELLLALCLGQAFKRGDTDTRDAAILFSRKLEGQNHFFFAVEILKIFTSDEDASIHWTPIHALCARYNGDPSHRENLHKYASIKSTEQFYEEGVEYEKCGQLERAVQCFLLSSHQCESLDIGLRLLCEKLNNDSWSVFEKSLAEISAVFSIPSAFLTQVEKCSHKNKLLTISAYFGALKAIHYGYTSIVSSLLEHTIAMAERLEMMQNGEVGDCPFPIRSSDMKNILNAWKAYHTVIASRGKKISPDEGKDQIIRALLQKAEVTEVSDSSLETIVAGSSLPSHSDVHVSSLTNKRINGPTFCLEDGCTIISLNEAIMWARVNEFSPTGSGERITPF